MKELVTIDHEKYGVRFEAASLEDADRKVEQCGFEAPGFCFGAWDADQHRFLVLNSEGEEVGTIAQESSTKRLSAICRQESSLGRQQELDKWLASVSKAEAMAEVLSVMRFCDDWALDDGLGASWPIRDAMDNGDVELLAHMVAFRRTDFARCDDCSRVICTCNWTEFMCAACLQRFRREDFEKWEQQQQA